MNRGVNIDSRAQLPRDIFLGGPVYYLPNGEILGIGVFAMQEGGGDPGFVGDPDEYRGIIRDSNIP